MLTGARAFEKALEQQPKIIRRRRWRDPGEVLLGLFTAHAARGQSIRIFEIPVRPGAIVGCIPQQLRWCKCWELRTYPAHLKYSHTPLNSNSKLFVRWQWPSNCRVFKVIETKLQMGKTQKIVKWLTLIDEKTKTRIYFMGLIGALGPFVWKICLIRLISSNRRTSSRVHSREFSWSIEWFNLKTSCEIYEIKSII